jgi:membrane-bound metal-dependent hydrolase YbcI (DUF457 family)
MFAVSHLAFGYLFAKICQKFLKVDINLPLIFLLSLLPDADLLVHGLLHRGITHSIIVITIVFIPVFLFYRKQSIPYFIAIIQHSFPDDFITGEGTQIFWPLTAKFFGLEVSMESTLAIAVEVGGFLLAMMVFIVTKDLAKLLKPQVKNLLLILPAAAVLVSAVISWINTASVALLIAHGIFLLIFTASVLSSIEKKVVSCFRL